MTLPTGAGLRGALTRFRLQIKALCETDASFGALQGRTVENMERALGFYRDLLGLQVVDDAVCEGPEAAALVGVEDARYRCVFLSADGKRPYVELIEYLQSAGGEIPGAESAATIGSTHCCLLVDDIHAEQERLTAAGVKFNGPPLLDTGDGLFAGEYCTYCYDPDGFAVELWSRPADKGAQTQ